MRSKPFRQKSWKSSRDSSSLITPAMGGRCFPSTEAAPTNSLTAMFCNFQLKGGFMLEGLLQPTHLLVIFGIALLVFGPKKLPELGKGIGEGIRGFKSAMKDKDNEKPDSITAAVASEQSPTQG